MAFIKSCSIHSRNDQSPKCEVVYEIKLTSEIFWPTHTCLAQSVEHRNDDQEVLGSIPIRNNLLFCSSLSMLAGFCQNLAEIDLFVYHPGQFAAEEEEKSMDGNQHAFDVEERC